MPTDMSTSIVASSERLNIAKDFLKGFLTHGPMTSTDIHVAAEKQGIRAGTLDRARKSLKIKLERVPKYHGGTFWTLPGRPKIPHRSTQASSPSSTSTSTPPSTPPSPSTPSSTSTSKPKPEPAYLLLTKTVGQVWRIKEHLLMKTSSKDEALAAYSKAKAAGQDPRLFREVKVVEEVTVTLRVDE